MNSVILQILKERVNKHHICHPLFQYFTASILECENEQQIYSFYFKNIKIRLIFAETK